MKNAYISCPMTVSQTVLDEVIKLVVEYKATPIFWRKDSMKYDEVYFTSIIKECDAFIVILPAVAWKCEYDKMTSGSRKELSLALEAKRPIYLAYASRYNGNKMDLYATDITEIKGGRGLFQSISGIASTRFNFRDSMSAISCDQDKAEEISKLGQQFHKDSLDTWIGLKQELIKQSYQIDLEKAIFPAYIDDNAPFKLQWEKVLEYFEQTGTLVFDVNTRLNVTSISDNRILLFF